MVDTRRTDLVLLLVALVWGSSYLAAKDATGSAPVLVVLFVRYLISAVVCFPLVLCTARRTGGRWTAQEVRIGAVLGVTQAAVLVLEMYGVARTTAANAGLLISLTLVITPVLDGLAGRRGSRNTLPARFFLAAGTCVVAVALLTSGTGLRAPGTGDALILAAAVVRAAHVVLVGRLTAGRDLRPLQLTSVQTAVGTLLCLAPAAGGLPALPRLSAEAWGQLTYLALLCSVFAFLAQTWAVQRTSAGRASLLLGTEPVWALATGIGIGGEQLTPIAAFGALLMLAGTYWGQSVEQSHRKAVEQSHRRAVHQRDQTSPPPPPSAAPATANG